MTGQIIKRDNVKSEGASKGRRRAKRKTWDYEGTRQERGEGRELILTGISLGCGLMERQYPTPRPCFL